MRPETAKQDKSDRIAYPTKLRAVVTDPGVALQQNQTPDGTDDSNTQNPNVPAAVEAGK
jgi:hypothetical protein